MGYEYPNLHFTLLLPAISAAPPRYIPLTTPPQLAAHHSRHSTRRLAGMAGCAFLPGGDWPWVCWGQVSLAIKFMGYGVCWGMQLKIIPLILFITSLPIVVFGTTESHYDASGKYIGKSISDKGMIRHYDKSGHLTSKGTVSKKGSRHYDSMGRFQGYSTQSKSNERKYDRNGRYVGYSSSKGLITRHYDSLGRYTGKDIRSSNFIRHYDKLGRYQGQSKEKD